MASVALRFLLLRICALSYCRDRLSFDMQFEYRELGGVWDTNRLLKLEQNELTALAFEYNVDGRGTVSAFLQYSLFKC